MFCLRNVPSDRKLIYHIPLFGKLRFLPAMEFSLVHSSLQMLCWNYRILQKWTQTTNSFYIGHKTSSHRKYLWFHQTQVRFELITKKWKTLLKEETSFCNWIGTLWFCICLYGNLFLMGLFFSCGLLHTKYSWKNLLWNPDGTKYEGFDKDTTPGTIEMQAFYPFLTWLLTSAACCSSTETSSLCPRSHAQWSKALP